MADKQIEELSDEALEMISGGDKTAPAPKPKPAPQPSGGTLTLDGIAGESLDSNHRDTIE